MENQIHTVANKFSRVILFICAWISLLIGIIGILLPIIPTAILIFVSAGMFAKSSPRLYNWLVNSRLLGKYIKKYHQERNIPLTVKFISIIFLNLSIGYTAIFATSNILLRSFLVLFSVLITVYIVSIRSRQLPSEVLQIEES
ncbi:MAG: YbaN family protein [Bacillota bacterium]